LEEGEILLEARILAVADTVEALASHRPYRAAADISEVMCHINENRSTLFDPKVVTSCTRVFESGFEFEEPGPHRRSEHRLD
jgi:HD-GYP domain-containing protein (c-di-GMP phosphodiesterase class II)